MPVTIEKLLPESHQAWNDYVLGQDGGTLFHLVEWLAAIEKCYGHANESILARESDQVVGVLPLMAVRSALFGNRLTSTPYAVYGGAVGNSEQIATQLEDAAVEIARGLGVQYLELRNRDRSRDGWAASAQYATFRKPIEADVDANMKAIPRKQRAMVRKGINAGLVAEFERSIDHFYPIYSESVRNLGTPVFPRRHFQCLLESFGDKADVLTVRHDQVPIASVMSFYFRDEVLPYYGGGTDQARQFKGYDYMYWELMKAACERGLKTFDYGRSKVGTGAYSFKKNWGFEPAALPYQFQLVRARELPNMSPTNPKYQYFINVWKRLPLPIANTIGPFLARSLG